MVAFSAGVFVSFVGNTGTSEELCAVANGGSKEMRRQTRARTFIVFEDDVMADVIMLEDRLVRCLMGVRVLAYRSPIWASVKADEEVVDL